MKPATKQRLQRAHERAKQVASDAKYPGTVSGILVRIGMYGGVFYVLVMLGTH